jgi:hypothetical protein
VVILALAGAAAEWPQEHDSYPAQQLERRLAPVLRHFPEESAVGVLTAFEDNDLENMTARYLLLPRHVVFLRPETRPEWAIGLGDVRQKAADLGYETVREWEADVLLLHRKGE